MVLQLLELYSVSLSQRTYKWHVFNHDAILISLLLIMSNQTKYLQLNTTRAGGGVQWAAVRLWAMIEPVTPAAPPPNTYYRVYASSSTSANPPEGLLRGNGEYLSIPFVSFLFLVLFFDFNRWSAGVAATSTSNVHITFDFIQSLPLDQIRLVCRNANPGTTSFLILVRITTTLFVG